jgi:GT2 family glycosyltransferase
MTATVGCVVLTMGDRREQLARAVESLLSQRQVELDVVVVGNGWEPTGLPDGVRGLGLPENRGIPAGRAAGAEVARGDLLFFLDDDAALAEPDFLARAASAFESDERLGVVQPRPVDPSTGETPRRFVPRLRVGDPARSGPVTALWEGALVVRRAAYDAAGGWKALYWYAHEGVELAWRVWDAGFTVRYDGGLVVWHDAVVPTRHPEFYRHQARNRVWLARRNLPAPLALLYLANWVLLTVLRTRSLTAWRESWLGWLDGLRQPCGERRVLRWGTVWRMLRAGRPPIV